MRGTVAGLVSPAPLVTTLPSMLRADPFAAALCDGLDEVLAPVLLSLDSLPAQLDVRTAPDDLLPWLAQWVGMTSGIGSAIDIDLDRLRNLLAGSQQLHLRRGTRLGIERALSAELGLDCEVTESGATEWSAEAGRPLPAGELREADGPMIVVTVHPATGQTVDEGKLDAVLATITPAHVRRRIEVAR